MAKSQTVQPVTAAPRRSLAAALFGTFFRLTIVLAAVEFAVFLMSADRPEMQGQPLGYVLRYAIWAGIGEASFYPALDEFLQANQSALPVLLPIALSAALTLFFLPSINAMRRRAGGRFVVILLNLFVGWSGIGWIMALIASFAGDGRRPHRTEMMPAARDRPARPRRSILPSAGSAPVKPARSAVVRTTGRAEPAVMRRTSSQSWVRPR
jgi:hypothetical protein